jgi:ATP-dependent Clp protease ATP-binding subunit ClpA
VFERFTEHARQVVVLAQDEARALLHNYIGTEHLLLGLLREQEGLVGSRVLASFGITLEEVRAQVVRIVGQGDEVVPGPIPFTKHATRVLELALREALSLGHNYIGTEHILLGLVRENEGSRRGSCLISMQTRRRSATRSSECSAGQADDRRTRSYRQERNRRSSLYCAGSYPSHSGCLMVRGSSASRSGNTASSSGGERLTDHHNHRWPTLKT